MADLTVFPIPQIPSGYNKSGKYFMLHDLTQPEATSTKLISFEKVLTTEVTYADFYTMITNSQLIVGMTYVITDFQTVYDQMDFDNNGALKSTLVTKTGATEQIWVLALAPNQIADKAYSATYPKDEIQYDWTYNTTLVNGSPAKGRISERVDEWNNRTDYDHREIRFIRYDDGAGNFTIINDNGNSSQEFLTFGNNYANGGIIHDNWLGDFYSIGQLIGQEYSNNVFLGFAYVNNYGNSFFYNNTFFDYAVGNRFDGDMHHNIFNGYIESVYNVGDFYFNIFNSNVENTTVNGQLQGNVLNVLLKFIKINGNIQNNIFAGTYINSVSFDGYIVNKTIDQSTYPFLFGSDYEKRIILASDGNNYIRYFDGTTDLNILIP